MTIEKLLQITGGVCINTTSKEELNSATVQLKKVSEDDLFIAQNKDEIELAIKQGASAILFEGELSIDADVALIKVDSIQLSAMKIISYIVKDDKDLHFYLLEPHVISYLKMLKLKQNDIEYLPDSWQKSFELILNSDRGIFVCDDKTLMKQIKPKIKIFDEMVYGYNIEDTLFRSTFRVDKFVYQHKKMAPFHLDYLLKAVAIFKKHKLPYSIDRIDYTKHFIPIFIDGETHIQKAEKNDHVVIVTDNVEDISEGREYAKNIKIIMSKSIVFTPPKIKIDSYTNPTIFRNPTQLTTVVKTTSFNYGFVYSKDREDLKALKEYFRV